MEATTRIERMQSWVGGLTPRSQWALVFVVMATIYLPTATWDLRIHTDAATAALPAFQLAQEGTLDLTSLEDFILDRGVVDEQTVVVDDKRYSNRNPGVILSAYPAYAVQRLVMGRVDFSTGPAAITASLITAAAVATMSLVLRRLTSPRDAIVGALIAGLATPTWSVSADSTWPHGPTQLWLALALLMMARPALARAGLAYGAAVFTRPYAAMAAAVTGIYLSMKQRDWRPTVIIGVTSALGLAGFLLYSRLVFTVTSVYGGYTSRGYHEAHLTSTDAPSFLSDLALSLLSPTRGVLLHSAFLGVLVFGLRPGWRSADVWVKAAALSGLAYWIFQVRANRYIGGGFYFGYRYQLEALWLAAPLFYLAWREWVRGRQRAQLAFWGMVVAAVVLQILGAAVEVYKV